MTFKDHSNYNCTIELTSNETYNVAGNWLHNAELDNWLGWKCRAGSMRISIDEDKVYSGDCKNDYLGTLDTEWNLISEYTVCKRETCTGCTDDLIVEKWRNDE